MVLLFDAAKQYAFHYPERDGGTWNQWCLSLMARFNDFAHSWETAHDAYRASNILSLDPTTAQVGAFHFWDIGSAGHIAQDLTGGGRVAFMASGRVTTSWGNDIGTAPVQGYTAKSGATYLGWARYCGDQAPRAASDLGTGYKPVVSPVANSTWRWTEPEADVAEHIQQALKARGRYSGLIDGDWGPLSIQGIQLTIEHVGYTGLIDGKPGPMTCFYTQKYSATYGGYDGPLDKKLGVNTWDSFLRGVQV